MSRKEMHVWLTQTSNISITTFSEQFHYVDRDQAYADFEELVGESRLKLPVKIRLLQDFEIWKSNKSNADLFWLGRQTSIAARKGKTVASTNLIEAATSDLPTTIKNGASVSDASTTATVQIDSADATCSKDTSGIKAHRAASPKSPCSISTASATTLSSASSRGSPPPQSPVTKKRRAQYITDEPWHSLMISLIKLINGQNNMTFPEPPDDMKYIHRELFKHAVSLLQEYQKQSSTEKDITLIKDAQVVMSCLLNTMSPRVVEHFAEADDKELIDNAIIHTTIPGFEAHPCLEFLQPYSPMLKKYGIAYLRRKIVIDRGKLLEHHSPDSQLPKLAIVHDKVLAILTHLCDFIEKHPFGSAVPSENDCLQLWSYVFGVIVEKVTIHSGEKVLNASRVLRYQQASEYGDISEAGRKVDLIFMYKDIELSNVEFKRTDISSRDIAVQCRKNLRLGRCLQEAHAAIGFKDAPVLMGDVAGYVGLFYQVRPMQEISVAGKIATSMVYLPSTPGAMQAFLEGASLAMIWNFVEFLEKQGPEIAIAKELHELDLETKKFSQAIGSSRSTTPPPTTKKYQNSVTFSPTRKRYFNATMN